MIIYLDFNDLDVEDKPTYKCNKYILKVRSINGGSDYENVKVKSLTEYYKQVCKEMLDNLSINLSSTFTKEAEFTVEEIVDWLQNIKERINNETRMD